MASRTYLTMNLARAINDTPHLEREAEFPVVDSSGQAGDVQVSKSPGQSLINSHPLTHWLTNFPTLRGATTTAASHATFAHGIGTLN